MRRLKKLVKCVLQERLLASAVLRLKSCNIVLYKGAQYLFEKESCVVGNAKLHFNMPHYGNGFRKNGNLYLGKNAKLILNGPGMVFFYPGCKVDVFSGAQLVLGSGVYVNDSTRIGSKCSIIIGNDTVIGDDVSIHDFDGHKINEIEGIKPIEIGAHVWIGEKVVILKGVKIGDNAIIGAGSVVTKDIPSGVIAVGNPARVIKHIDSWS